MRDRNSITAQAFAYVEIWMLQPVLRGVWVTERMPADATIKLPKSEISAIKIFAPRTTVLSFNNAAQSGDFYDV
jgi:hypothetical protein